ncbi:MAG: hypothetical protein Q9171_007603, partial [Xanthocarpia ochracea]
MPKGQKFVDWANTNNVKKLLYAIIVTSDVSVNYEKVAKVFGDDVPASCIYTQVLKIRKEARNGIASTSSASNRASTQRGPTYGTKKPSSKTIDVASDESDEEMEIKIKQDSEDGISTPKTSIKGKDKIISGRITKARKSPRSSVLKDYQKMLDPFNDFVDVVDEGGNAIFARQGMTPEDSLDSDK